MDHARSEIRFSIIVPTHNRLNTLQHTVQSLLSLDYVPNAFEVIIVADNCHDQTGSWLARMAGLGHLHWISVQANSAAAARNEGARRARGKYLVFTDDDCQVPKDWLNNIEQVFNDTQASMVGGQVFNKVPRPAADASQFVIDQLAAGYNNLKQNRALFLTSNNLAIVREVFITLGLFDEQFAGAGAEDRELCYRFTGAERTVIYSDKFSVDHYHDLSFKHYLSQQVNYGKGSFLLYRLLAERGMQPQFIANIKIYLRLLVNAFRTQGFRRGLMYLFLIITGQCAVLWGYYSASKKAPVTEDRKVFSKEASGLTNTLDHFLPLIAASFFSVLLGLFNLILVKHTLSTAMFGIFSTAISLHLILISVVDFGISSSVSRYAAEASQKRDSALTRAYIFTGFVLLSILTLVLGTLVCLAAWKFPTMVSLHVIPLMIYYLLPVGVAGNVFMIFLSSVHSVFLQFRKAAFLHVVALGSRLLALVVLVLLAQGAGIKEIFLVYVLCYWVAILYGFKLLRQVLGNHRHRFAFKNRFKWGHARQLLFFGNWITFGNVLSMMAQNIGPLLVLYFSTPVESGIFGLGLITSFFLGILAGNVSSYLYSFAARLDSEDGIIAYMWSCLKITLPLSLAVMIISLLAYFIFPVIFGQDGRAAYPVFLFLAVQHLLALIYRPVHGIFQYLLKPYLITIDMAIRFAGTVLLATLVVPHWGALGMALANAFGLLGGMVFSLFLYVKMRSGRELLALFSKTAFQLH